MGSYNLKAPRCQHVKDNGIQCGSPALRSQAFCYQHQRIHHSTLRPGDKGYVLPPLESPLSVTLSVVQVAQAAHDGRISIQLARLLLYAIQLGAPYAGRSGPPYAPEVTIDLPPAMAKIFCGADTPVRDELPTATTAASSTNNITTKSPSINSSQLTIDNSDCQITRSSDHQAKNRPLRPQQEKAIADLIRRSAG